MYTLVQIIAKLAITDGYSYSLKKVLDIVRTVFHDAKTMQKNK